MASQATTPVHVPKTRFKNLLCDLDGTLIDSGDLRVHLDFIRRSLPGLKRHQGWKAAIRALKESQSILKIPSTIETNFERLISVFQKNFKLDREQAIEEMKNNVDGAFAKLEGHFGEMMGASQFVDWAHGKYTLTLATNPAWSVDIVKLRMRWGGINPDFFQSITTADRMHASKPTLEYYREILLQEKFEAADCLLIGNEREMDLPATGAGIAVFLIRTQAKALTCIEVPSEKSPGAWRGNYTHLQQFLEKNSGL
jgi:FMN phosphatase YigB (HAD superfamily)